LRAQKARGQIMNGINIIGGITVQTIFEGR